MKWFFSQFLSQLLPYEPEIKRNGDIRIALKEYQTLLRVCLGANEAMERGDLDKFDALVGENACQIRAVWLCLIASRSSIDTNSFNDRIMGALNKIDILLTPSVIEPILMSGRQSFELVLKENNLDILMNFEEMLIVQSYLLCEMKTTRSSHEKDSSLYRLEVAAPKNLKCFGDVTTSFARNLLSSVRQQLSFASVGFVQHTANAFDQPSLIKMISNSFVETHNALSCIPMFWTYKIILHEAERKNIPLIIHAKFVQKEEAGYEIIDEEKLFYKTDPYGSYIEVEPNEIDSKKPACIIEGIVVSNSHGQVLTKSEWKAKMRKRSVVDVILAGAADHRQYPDPKLDEIFDSLSHAEYHTYKALAKKEGFSSDNPSVFFIQHVYAIRVGKILERIPTMIFEPAEGDENLEYAFSQLLSVGRI